MEGIFAQQDLQHRLPKYSIEHCNVRNSFIDVIHSQLVDLQTYQGTKKSGD